MSTTGKVELVRSVRGEFGLTPALAVLGLPRATWYYRATHPEGYEDRHAQLRAPLERIARDHPEYGYRRTTTELRERLGESVNEKVVRRLHQCWGLPLLRQTQPPRPSGLRQVITAAGERVSLLAQLDEVGPLAAFHTDLTELVYASGKAQLNGAGRPHEQRCARLGARGSRRHLPGAAGVDGGDTRRRRAGPRARGLVGGAE